MVGWAFTMIPKCQGSTNVSNFQSISLSNSIYLIVAKILTNRLKEVIGEFIGPFQSTFILVRQLVDNTILTKEIISTWKVHGIKGFLWKVDFAKTYDSLEWNFLWVVLRKRGFPKEWVK